MTATMSPSVVRRVVMSAAVAGLVGAGFLIAPKDSGATGTVTCKGGEQQLSGRTAPTRSGGLQDET